LKTGTTMATKTQKQELINALKFTPIKVNLMLQGYGGESYAGTIDRKIYDHFKANKYDLDEYASDSDGEWSSRIPTELQPFSPGSPYECDNLWHASGAELSDLNEVTITDEHGKEVWAHNLGWNALEDSGVVVDQGGGTELDDLQDGTVVFWGGQGEKGCFFDAEFTLREPFDPKKLNITYENCDGWYLINGVEYDGEELDGFGGYSTTGKWGENKWIIVGDEEIYESVPWEEREEVDNDEQPVSEWPNVHVTGTDNPIDFPTSTVTNKLSTIECECVQCDWHGPIDDTYDQDGEMQCPECGEPVELIDTDWDPVAELDKIIAPVQVTDWYDKDIKPVRKGEYEVNLGALVAWPFARIVCAEWTGRTWKDSEGKSVKGIVAWRGLKFDPNA
jgi:hypothetical protein